jgi:DNA-binding NarL/FixJ family response regulator
MVEEPSETRTEVVRPGPSDSATVVIVDNDRGLCELLRSRLDSEPLLACVGIATAGEDARRLVKRESPAVILLDFSLGPGVDALALGAELVDLSSASQLLIWTKWADPTPGGPEALNRMLRARQAGATDWISKGEGINTLMERIHAAVSRGRPTLDSPLSTMIIDRVGHEPVAVADPLEALTRAERRWAREVARGSELGKSIEEIGRDNSVSADTLRTHMKSVYDKLNVHTRPAFVKRARELGLI